MVVSIPPHPRRNWGWLAVLGTVVVIFGLPALLDRGAPLRLPLDDHPLRVLQRAHPRGVLIGDSMLETRIDPKILSAAAGERWEVLSQPGGSSAVWYLMLKNFVAVQTPPPHTVVVFFRDRQLTLPVHRTHDGYERTLEKYMRPSEPELENILKRASHQEKTWPERLSHAVYPVQWRRAAWQNKMQSWALDLVAQSSGYQQIRDDAQAIFALGKLRDDGARDFEVQEGGQGTLDPLEHEFGAMAPRSFLPLLVEAARASGIRLVFFRVKRKPPAADQVAEETATTQAYMDELRVYLETRGATLIDETREADMTRAFYGADDHVAPGQMRAYTELFWRKFGKHLQLPTSTESEPAR